jgi:hypothetical protein
MGAKPEGVTTTRYMAVYKVDSDAEVDPKRVSERRAAVKRTTDKMSNAGVLLLAEGFEPSAKGRRLNLPPASGGSRSKPIIRDGPFTESKELIGGFVMVEASSLDEATRWAEKYIDIVETAEVDIVPLVG